MRHKYSLSNGQIQILDEILNSGIYQPNVSAEIINDLYELQRLGLTVEQQNSGMIGWGITQTGIAFVYAYHTITGK